MAAEALMAYLSFSPLVAENASAAGAATAADAGRFTAVELRVIALAEREDSRYEIAPGSMFGRLLEAVFGVKLRRPLADGRLEALRRFASLARHHPDRLGASDVQALVNAGYSPGQVYGLLGYLAPSRDRAESPAFA
jgi:hypothetical protein